MKRALKKKHTHTQHLFERKADAKQMCCLLTPQPSNIVVGTGSVLVKSGQILIKQPLLEAK